MAAVIAPTLSARVSWGAVRGHTTSSITCVWTNVRFYPFSLVPTVSGWPNLHWQGLHRMRVEGVGQCLCIQSTHTGHTSTLPYWGPSWTSSPYIILMAMLSLVLQNSVTISIFKFYCLPGNVTLLMIGDEHVYTILRFQEKQFAWLCTFVFLFLVYKKCVF